MNYPMILESVLLLIVVLYARTHHVTLRELSQATAQLRAMLEDAAALRESTHEVVSELADNLDTAIAELPKRRGPRSKGSVGDSEVTP